MSFSNPLSTQIGGDHYKSFTIQPIEFAHDNGFPPCLFSVLKYVLRYADKGKPFEDLDKAIHYCQLQLKLDEVATWKWTNPTFQVLHFCGVNGLSASQTYIVQKLCYYRDAGSYRSEVITEIIVKIEEIKQQLRESIKFERGGE